MTQALTNAQTLGELKAAGYRQRTVKEEIRANLMRKLRAGETIFPGILGYERTVIPQLQNALLGKHDIILLGLRGQAKSRIIRMIPTLLDAQVPIIAGSPLNEDPLQPVTKHGRELVEAQGDDTPIEWLPREARYGEKLATPDTTIADLIGDIDPIKAANLRLTYADEEVIHFGIIPRTNRGVFAINELPDLQPRIQVGLLNILEEQDIQIRGFNVRFPLDVLMVFSANPEDYTSRGNLITPLKDRIDSQILTHYPKTIDIGIEITRQEAWQQRDAAESETADVRVPHIFREVIEQIAFEARASEYVDQQSGVSVRMTRAALEDLISAAERRALINNEQETTVRVSDLNLVAPAITGKVELVYEGEQEGAQNVALTLIGRAIKTIFTQYFPDPADKEDGRDAYRTVLQWFAEGHTVTLDQDQSFEAYRAQLDRVEGLQALVTEHTTPTDAAAEAAMMELVLEALHQNSLVGKELSDGGRSYNDMMGSMLSGLGGDGGFDDDDDSDAWDAYQ
ncbi:P-loop NTPase family protein [Salisaeta longa]|uniref:magnesium chelatase n=1 Tax=Salisaeta longa TaxID=503170 RepID=UPI000414BF9A|nr:magnesium chelatase [Salisaeta longa]